MASSCPLFTLGLLPRHLSLISAGVPGKMSANNGTSITPVWPWTDWPSTNTTHAPTADGLQVTFDKIWLDMSDNKDNLASQTKQLVSELKICPISKQTVSQNYSGSYWGWGRLPNSLHMTHTRMQLQPLAYSSFRVWGTSHCFVHLTEIVFPSCSLSDIRHSQVPLKHSSTCQLTAGGWLIKIKSRLPGGLKIRGEQNITFFILNFWKNKTNWKSMDNQTLPL